MSAAATDPQLLQQAFDHYTAGRMGEAEAIYRQILTTDPQQADALHLLGIIAFQTGNVKPAIELIGRAIAARPGAASFWANLAGILNHQLQFEHAGKACGEALRINPEYADAYFHLGNALHGKKEFPKAIIAFQEAIKRQPNSPETFNAMGITFSATGNTSGAIAAYRKAIELRPDMADARSNLGSVMHFLGRWDEAIAEYRHAIQLQPTLAESYSNLGNVLQNVGRGDEAIAACREAIAMRPADPAPYNNLATALASKGQLDEAAEALLKSLSLYHGNAKTWNNLGNVQFNLGRLDEAITSYETAAKISPDDPSPGSNRVYALHFHPHHDASSILRSLKEWDAKYAKSFMPMIRSYSNSRTPGRRLRLGYVSPDFRQHVVGYNMLPVFEQHDRGAFEIFCYANVTQPDAMTDQFRSLSDHWQSIVGLNDQAVAEKVRADQIDVLVDLALHLSGNRLLVFARKPAPVQVTFAGYPAGTGMEAMDYRLTDPHLDPPIAREQQYVEQSIALPDSFWCYDPRDPEPAVNALPVAGGAPFTFGCLNNFNKVNDEVIALWAKVLLATPNSRLIVMAPAGTCRDQFRAKMSAAGVSADRIDFADRSARRQYLEHFHRIDLGLDTFPYNGHTTSLDSLWMGVPVLTMIGQSSVGRAGWSQLSNLGLTELASLDEKHFVQLAAQFAADLPRLADLRRTLRQRMQSSPLMDAKSFTRNIEAAYKQMWRAWAMV